MYIQKCNLSSFLIKVFPLEFSLSNHIPVYFSYKIAAFIVSFSFLASEFSIKLGNVFTIIFNKNGRFDKSIKS